MFKKKKKRKDADPSLEGTVIRAFELPLQHAEPEVWEVIREAWKQGGMLANWCVRWLVVHDVTRMPGMEKLPKMPLLPTGGVYKAAASKDAFNLMGKGGGVCGCGCSWWAGASGSFAAITKCVTEYWMEHRYAVLWLGSEQPPHFGYPYPFPVRSQEWKGLGWEGSRPYVDVNLPSGTPWKPILARLRLRAGAEFGRQIGIFREIEAGNLPRVQLVIRQQGSSLSCHRATVRGGGQGGNREPARVMIKLVARLPVRPAPGMKTLTLITDPGAFWVAEMGGRQAWVLNNDHMRRACDWLQLHEDRRQRLAQDRKAEYRLDMDREGRWQRSLERCCRKHARRMASWLHETSAHLVGFCERNQVGVVLYRDLDQGFAPAFPWHRLKTLLVDKLKAAGIVCQCASDEPMQVIENVVETVEAIVPVTISKDMEDQACLNLMEESARAGMRLNRARRSGSHPSVTGR